MTEDFTPRPSTPSVLATLATLGVPVFQGEGEASKEQRFTIVEQLARGGMGVVFKVRDEDLRRDLAMKVLHRGTAGSGEGSADPRHLGRFLEEAQVSGQLDHPGVVPIHELGLDADGRLYFTMRLVRGRTLDEVFAMARRDQNGWSITRALGVLLKVCEAMAYAHHKQVIHRDLKPANIMVGRFGETYVMDWGLAKVLDGAREAGGEAVASISSATQSVVQTDRKEMVESDGSTSMATLDGDVVGTPAYMPPEQARGQVELLGPTTDIYALGALLYDLLAGQPPYLEPGQRAHPHAILRWVLDGPPKPVAELAPERPAELVAICERAMAREPGDRYSSMLELAEDIQAFIENRVVDAYRTGAVIEFKKWVARNKGMAASLAAVVLVAIVGLGAVGWVQADGKRALGRKAGELESANVALADANDDLEAANRSAGEARDEAVANARLAADNEARARASEAEALRQSYVANIAAAASALERGAAGAARRRLEAAAPELRGWEWQHLNLAADTSLGVLGRHDQLVWEVVFGPRGDLVASASGPYWGFGGSEGGVRLWDVATGELLHDLPGHDSPVIALGFRPDGEVLATGSTDGVVRRFDVSSGRPVGIPRYMGPSVQQLTYLPDGDRIALITGLPGRLQVWNTRTLDVEFEASTAGLGGRCLALAPDGRTLAGGFHDGTKMVYDVPTGELLWSWHHDDPSAFSGNILEGTVALDVSPDGGRLLAVDSDQRAQIFELRTGRRLGARSLPRQGATGAAFSPGGRTVLVSDLSGAMQFYDGESTAGLEVLNGHDQFVTCFAFSPDGSRIVSGSWDKTLRLWEGHPGTTVTTLEPRSVKNSSPDSPHTLAYSPDGRRLSFRPGTEAVHVVDPRTGEFLYTVEGKGRGERFTPDSSRLLLYTLSRGLVVCDAATGRVMATPTGVGVDPGAVAFNVDCSLLAVSGSVDAASGRWVDVYHVGSGAYLQRLGGPARGIRDIIFTADSRRVLASSDDGKIWIWDLSSAEVVAALEEGGQPYDLLLLPGDEQLLSTSFDPSRNGLRRWDLETGELLETLTGSSLFTAVEAGPGAERLVTPNLDGSLSLWDLELGEVLNIAGTDRVAGSQAVFSPDGSQLAFLNSAGTLRLLESARRPEWEELRREARAREARLMAHRELLDTLREEHLMPALMEEALRARDDLDGTDRSLLIREAHIEGADDRGTADVIARALGERDPDPAIVARNLRWAEGLAALRGEFAQVAHILAWARYRAGDLEGARDALDVADRSIMTIAGGDRDITSVLACILAAEAGDRGLAEAHLRTARRARARADADYVGIWRVYTQIIEEAEDAVAALGGD